MAVQGVHTTTSGQPLEAMATSPVKGGTGAKEKAVWDQASTADGMCKRRTRAGRLKGGNGHTACRTPNTGQAGRPPYSLTTAVVQDDLVGGRLVDCRGVEAGIRPGADLVRVRPQATASSGRCTIKQ